MGVELQQNKVPGMSIAADFAANDRARLKVFLTSFKLGFWERAFVPSKVALWKPYEGSLLRVASSCSQGVVAALLEQMKCGAGCALEIGGICTSLLSFELHACVQQMCGLLA